MSELTLDDPAMVPQGTAGDGQRMPSDAPQGGEQASPEEQKQYDDFVAHGLLLVYSKPQFFAKVLDMLEGAGDPVEGLAQTTALVVARVMGAAEKAGQKMPGDVVFHAGKELFEDMAELSGRAGIKDFTADPDAMESAFFRAADQLRSLLQGAGKIDRNAAAGDMAKLQQMDEAGELKSMFEGLAARDSDGSEPMPEPEQPRGLAMGMM